MAKVKISQLPVPEEISGDERIAAIQGNVTVGIPVNEVNQKVLNTLGDSAGAGLVGYGETTVNAELGNLNTVKSNAADLADTVDADKGAAMLGFDGESVDLLLENAKAMQGYGALRGYSGRAVGVRITTPGVAGIFQRDDADTTTADDGALVIVDAVGRRWKRQYSGKADVRWFGAKGDNVTDDTTALLAAQSYSVAFGADIYYPPGLYITTASLPDLHTHNGYGEGVIVRGADTWHIQSSKDSDLNIIYVNAAGLTANDGLSLSQPTTISNAFSVIQELGVRAAYGTWRIRISGTITSPQVRFNKFPLFEKRLEVWGDEVDMYASEVPTTVWDGTTAGANRAALRFEKDTVSRTFNKININFRNIKFANWTTLGGSNGYGIQMWAPHDVLAQNLHAANCSIPFSYEYGTVRQQYGIIDDAELYGIAVLYHETANIGDLLTTNNGGVTFNRCPVGIEVGRMCVAYIQSCTFNDTGVNHVRATRLARWRTQNCTFNVSGGPAEFSETNAAQTGDNGAGWPNIYNNLSDAVPAYKAVSGGVNLLVDLCGQPSLHNVSDGLAVINSTARTLLASVIPDGTWTPFRLPGYFMFGRTVKLSMDIIVQVAANVGGVLELCGASPDVGARFGSLTIPADPVSKTFCINMTVVKPGSANSASNFILDCPALGIFKQRTAGPTLNNSYFRTPTETPLLYRVYWTSTAVGNVTIYSMRSYVEQ